LNLKKMRYSTERRAWLVPLMISASLLCFVDCRRQSPAGETEAFQLDDPEKQKEIVLEVEGTAYTNADFTKYLQNSVGNSLKSLTGAALSRLFDEFVDEKILLMRAQNEGVSLTEEEKAAYLAKLKSALQTETGEEPPLESDAAGLYDRLLVQKFLSLLVKDIAADDQEVANYYEQHKSEFLQPERVQVSQILLGSEGQASGVLDKLKNASEEEFRKIAKAESAGPEASKGGVMGVFKVGQLPSELEKVVFSLKEGEISRVVESTYGYHIFRLDNKFEPRLLTAEEASLSIRTKLLEQKSQQAVSAHLATLRKTMDWKSTTENLTFPYQRIENE
jgi:parvulin-like peptidyl-prolyl isomerase